MNAVTGQGTRRIPVTILIGLAIALGLPLCHLAGLARVFAGLGRFWSGEAAWLTFLAFILAYVCFVERRPLSSLGFRSFSPGEMALAVLAAILIVGGDIGISAIETMLHLKVTSQVSELFVLPFWLRVFLVVRAPIVEEVVFRGYGFERLAQLTGSPLAAASVTFALFAFAHYPGGGLALALVAAWGGLILTLLYLWRRNLWVTITAHCLTDAVGLLVVPALSAHH